MQSSSWSFVNFVDLFLSYHLRLSAHIGGEEKPEGGHETRPYAKPSWPDLYFVALLRSYRLRSSVFICG